MLVRNGIIGLERVKRCIVPRVRKGLAGLAKSKNYIEKVMFFCGQSRPWFNDQNECTFDGKIGIYAFVTTELAKRKSPNRPRTTPVTKPITSVSRDVIRRYLIDKLLPDIKANGLQRGGMKQYGYNKTIAEAISLLMIPSIVQRPKLMDGTSV